MPLDQTGHSARRHRSKVRVEISSRTSISAAHLHFYRRRIRASKEPSLARALSGNVVDYELNEALVAIIGGHVFDSLATVSKSVP